MIDIYFCGSLTPQELIAKYPDYYARESKYAGDIFYRSLFRGVSENGGKVYLTLAVDNSILSDCKSLELEGFVPFYIVKRNHKIADYFIVQWEEMLKFYPNAILGGWIY